MNTNTIFGFVVGVAAGVGGTLLVDHILTKRAQRLWDEDIEEIDPEESEDAVNPWASAPETVSQESSVIERIFPHDEKPDLEKLVDYRNYSDLAKKYNGEVDDKIDQVAEVVAETEIEHENIFDTAERVENNFEKKDAIPPNFRDKPIVGPYDIQEISAEQYRTEALDYQKASCQYFIHDSILVDADTLEQLDIRTTVGSDILEQIEADDILYVSNLSTEIDYEIVGDSSSYEEALRLIGKINGDEECQEETS